MQTSSQYPRLVTPVRLVKQPSAMPRGWGTVLQKCRCAELTRVQLNDQGFVDVCTDRKSTRLNSSHLVISYAVFCLKKKKTMKNCDIPNFVIVSRWIMQCTAYAAACGRISC